MGVFSMLMRPKVRWPNRDWLRPNVPSPAGFLVRGKSPLRPVAQIPRHIQNIPRDSPRAIRRVAAHFSSTSTKLMGAAPPLTTLCSTPSERR